MIRILYLLPSLATGGLERMVHLLATRVDRDRFEPSVQIFDKIGALKDATEDAGVPVRFEPRGPGFFDRRFLSALASRLRSERPDLVHAHNSTALVYAALAGRLAGGIPVVYTEHDRSFPGRAADRALHFAAGRMVTRVIVVAEWLKRALVRWEGFPERRIEVIPNGIDEARFTPVISRESARDRLGLARETRVVACVARFDPVKNHRLLLRAMGRVPDAVLMLAGYGPEQPALEALAASLGISARVRFLGEWLDVPTLLAASDLHALASRSEGMSLTLIETHAAGRPSVATSVGGNPEVIEDGRTGLLVPDGDEAALAAAITRVLGSGALARAMGIAARIRFEERFTLGTMVRAYEAVYASVLGQSRPEVACAL